MTFAELPAYRAEVLRAAFTKLHADQENASDDVLNAWLNGAMPHAASMSLASFHAACMALTPSFQCLLRWDLSPAAIAGLADEIMIATKNVLDGVAAVAPAQASWCNVMQALADDESISALLGSLCDFPHHVSASKELRDASSAADTKLSAFQVECSMRVDVFKSVKAYVARYESFKAQAAADPAFVWPVEIRPHSDEEQRFVDRVLRDFRRGGLDLPEAEQEKLRALKTRMSALSIEFSKNLGEENTTFELSKEQLEGLPEDWLRGRPKSSDGEKVLVDLKYPSYFPIVKLCKVPETRALVEKAFNSRCLTANSQILEELIRLRADEAALLGFPTSSAFVLDIRMAKSTQAVTQFLEELSVMLDPLADAERAELLELKQKECESRGLAFDNVINPFDFQYYCNQRVERKFEVDNEAIKRYFPLQVVTRGLLDIYQRLLGLQFAEVAAPHVWHEEVQMFEVKDTATGDLVGYFYLDLFPRAGKFGHAACFGLQSACIDPTKQWQVPVAACVANFSKGSAEQPSLLLHSEVETFFHEFGHVMHQLCSRARFSRFSGTHVERDFVEAPSQMLENWCWVPESLRLMSGHVDDNAQKLPEELLHKLIAAKDANVALLTKRQIVFGLFDQTVHAQRDVDTAAVFNDIQQRVAKMRPTEGTNFAAGFGHIAGGYQSSYYGYLWSEVFCEDMFATKFAHSVLDAEAGRQYRDKILARGGSMDAIDMLRDFLGREPSKAAFLRSKGLHV